MSRQVTIKPKYEIGNILEHKSGMIGKVLSISGYIEWSQKENGSNYIIYYCRNGDSHFHLKEIEIKRIVSEK